MVKGEVMGQYIKPLEGANIGGSLGSAFGSFNMGDTVSIWVGLESEETRCQVVNLHQAGATVFVNAPGENTRREALMPGQATTVVFNGEDSLSVTATDGPLLNFYVQTESQTTNSEG